MGIPVLARPLLGTLMLMNYFFWFCHWWQGSTGSPESCLACLLAHGVSSSSSWPLHLVSLLFCDSKVCKERQKIWYNWCSIIKLFFYISKERCEDTILVCHGWLHYRKWRHSSNRTDPQGDVIVTSWQNKTEQWAGGDHLHHGNMDNWSVSWLRGNNKKTLVTIGQAKRLMC